MAWRRVIDSCCIALGVHTGKIKRAWLVAWGSMQGRPAVLEVISEGVGGGAKHVYDLVSRLRDEYTFIVACPDNGPYFDRFQAIGVRIFALPSTAASPRSVLRLLWVIKRYGIGLVHAHGRKAGFHGRLAGVLTRT